VPAALREAVRYWEPRRAGFNLVLLLAALLAAWLGGDPAYLGRHWTGLGSLAALGNLGYCAAYPIDVLAQRTAAASRWRRCGRAALWLAGTLLGAAITAFAVVALFDPAGPIPTPD